jgi:hypothetical protein
MAMKPAELQKYNALKLVNRMKSASAQERFGGAAAAVPDRREQRRLDQARGLVPFAVKLESGLVKQIHARAQERGVPLNDLVADLLRRALEAK